MSGSPYNTTTDAGWQTTMHSGGVGEFGQMIWHFGPIEKCWCRHLRVCEHVCPEHPAPTPRGGPG